MVVSERSLGFVSFGTLRTSSLRVGHGHDDVQHAVQPVEVAVLAVALDPRRPVGQFVPLGERRGFPEVDHPDFGSSFAVVNKQQRAANHLQGHSETMGRLRGQETPSDMISLPVLCLRLLARMSAGVLSLSV